MTQKASTRDSRAIQERQERAKLHTQTVWAFKLLALSSYQLEVRLCNCRANKDRSVRLKLTLSVINAEPGARRPTNMSRSHYSLVNSTGDLQWRFWWISQWETLIFTLIFTLVLMKLMSCVGSLVQMPYRITFQTGTSIAGKAQKPGLLKFGEMTASQSNRTLHRKILPQTFLVHQFD